MEKDTKNQRVVYFRETEKKLLRKGRKDTEKRKKKRAKKGANEKRDKEARILDISSTAEKRLRMRQPY